MRRNRPRSANILYGFASGLALRIAESEVALGLFRLASLDLGATQNHLSKVAPLCPPFRRDCRRTSANFNGQKCSFLAEFCDLCNIFQEINGAQKRTRTSTPLRAPPPEDGASTNSAIWAHYRSADHTSPGSGRRGPLAKGPSPCQRKLRRSEAECLRVKAHCG